MSEVPPAKNIPILKVTPEMLAYAEQLAEGGRSLEGFDGPGVKKFLEEEQDFFARLQDARADLDKYPSAITRATYDTMLGKAEQLSKIAALRGQQAMEQRAATAPNRLN